jgi:hypothetical protein
MPALTRNKNNNQTAREALPSARALPKPPIIPRNPPRITLSTSPSCATKSRHDRLSHSRRAWAPGRLTDVQPARRNSFCCHPRSCHADPAAPGKGTLLRKPTRRPPPCVLLETVSASSRTRESSDRALGCGPPIRGTVPCNTFPLVVLSSRAGGGVLYIDERSTRFGVSGHQPYSSILQAEVAGSALVIPFLVAMASPSFSHCLRTHTPVPT